LTTDVGRILSVMHRVPLNGTLEFCRALQVAALCLKHRQNKNQKQRIVAFVGSPLDDTEADMVKLAKKLKKNNVAVDVVNFGEDSASNADKLEAFIAAVNSSESCHLLTVPPGPHHLADLIVTSPIVVGDGSEGAASSSGAAAVAVARAGGGAFAEFGGVDPNMDPELALALRLSMEEERARAAQGEPPLRRYASGGATALPRRRRSPPPPRDGDGCRRRRRFGCRAGALDADSVGGRRLRPVCRPPAPTRPTRRRLRRRPQAAAAGGDDDDDDLAAALAMSVAKPAAQAMAVDNAPAGGDDGDDDLAAALALSVAPRSAAADRRNACCCHIDEHCDAGRRRRRRRAGSCVGDVGVEGAGDIVVVGDFDGDCGDGASRNGSGSGERCCVSAVSFGDAAWRGSQRPANSSDPGAVQAATATEEVNANLNLFVHFKRCAILRSNARRASRSSANSRSSAATRCSSDIGLATIATVGAAGDLVWAAAASMARARARMSAALGVFGAAAVAAAAAAQGDDNVIVILIFDIFVETLGASTAPCSSSLNRDDAARFGGLIVDDALDLGGTLSHLLLCTHQMQL
jgi:hypothetical protein